MTIPLKRVFFVADSRAAARRNGALTIADMGADTDASGVAFRFLKKMLKERAKGRVTVTSYDAKARSDTEQRVVFCRRSKRRNYAIRIQRR